MKRQLISLVLLMLTTVTMMAQSVSKQINDIKRSKDYISAEATLDTQEQAYALAEELLSKQIEEYVSEEKNLRNAANVIVKDVAGKAERLQMSRGSMTRVFLYVKKSDVIAADNTRVLVQPKNAASAKTEKNTTVVNKETPKKETPVKKVEQTAKTTSDATVEPAKVEPIQKQSHFRPAGEGDPSRRLAKAWQQNVVDDLLACGNITEARAKMNRFRAELKVKRFGSPDNCRTPEKCFWIVFNDKEQIVTILGPGSDNRTNFRTLTADQLSNYSGLGAMWFTMAN